MTRVRHPSKEKMQQPVETILTDYMKRRKVLEAKKLFESKVKKLCTRTGMARIAAEKAVLAGYYNESEDSPTETCGQ
jgi:hypothetical protein